MPTQTLKVVRIGNSRGVRLPAPLLDQYRIGDAVIVERTEAGILLRPLKDGRLSWAETFKAMHRERETGGDDFSDLAAASADGLDTLER
jgi:antitoxin MazE